MYKYETHNLIKEKEMDVSSLLGGYNFKGKVSPFEMIGDELDEDGLGYEFHSLGVFRHKPTGKMWWAETSGCSCPSPYEEFSMNIETLESDMNVLNEQTFKEFEQAVSDFPTNIEEKHALILCVKDKLNV